MSVRIVRVNKRRPCSVCGKTDWCGVAEDNSFAICMRKDSGKPAANGGWVHRLDSETPLVISRNNIPPAPEPAPIRASIETRHAAYISLLDHLTLSPNHRAQLIKRGLNNSEIERNRYRSVPSQTEADLIAKELSIDLDLNHVPGFYRERGEYRMIFRAGGILIPVRDAQRRIQALQIRQDEGKPKYIWFSTPYKECGASSGAPIHFQNLHAMGKAGRAVITEGALKGDIIAFLENRAVISIAGVSISDGFGRQLKADLPELQHITIAFDMDWQKNPAVRKALFRLTNELQDASFTVQIKTWAPNFGKGYDDFLVQKAGNRRPIMGRNTASPSVAAA